MTLNEILLRKLAEWHPSHAGRHLLAVPDEGTGWSVAIAADHCEALSCLVWELSVRRTAEPSAEQATLRSWAEGIATRVTGLLEPLKVVEVDLARNEALLRSDTPTERADKRFYYEVLVRGTAEAVLRRYQGSAQPGVRREQVAYALTHEAIAKLAADLTADE